MSDLMLKLFVSLQTLRAREEGQGMVEYGLLAVLISVVAIVSLVAIGGDVEAAFDNVADALGLAGIDPLD